MSVPAVGNTNIRMLGTGLEMACNGGFLKCYLHLKRLPALAISYKLVPVQ